MFINRPKFERGKRASRNQKNHLTPVNGKPQGVTSYGRGAPRTNVTGARLRSYAEVVTMASPGQSILHNQRAACSQASQDVHRPPVVINTNMDQKAWLQKAWVGRLKNRGMFEKVEDELKWVLDTKVTSCYWADDWIILLNLDDSKATQIMQEEKTHGSTPILDLQKWSQDIRPTHRLAWILLWGLPPTAWESESMGKMVEPIGDMVEVDELVEQRRRLDVARILIRTTMTPGIRTELMAVIDGIETTLHVVKDTTWLGTRLDQKRMVSWMPPSLFSTEPNSPVAIGSDMYGADSMHETSEGSPVYEGAGFSTVGRVDRDLQTRRDQWVQAIGRCSLDRSFTDIDDVDYPHEDNAILNLYPTVEATGNRRESIHKQAPKRQVDSFAGQQRNPLEETSACTDCPAEGKQEQQFPKVVSLPTSSAQADNRDSISLDKNDIIKEKGNLGLRPSGPILGSADTKYYVRRKTPSPTKGTLKTTHTNIVSHLESECIKQDDEHGQINPYILEKQCVLLAEMGLTHGEDSMKIRELMSEMEKRDTKLATEMVFVGEASWDNIIVLKSMLRGFEMVSGLRINYAKSQFGVVGFQPSWAHDAAQFLNCRQLDIPFHYLGMPIAVKASSRMVWEPLINKFKAKLSKWNQKYLSMGGKVTLIKSVLNALPIYLLSFFKIPQRIVDKLVSLQRTFMWGGNQHHNRISWVKWADICTPKIDGGLGIKDLSKFNTTLRGRWIWDLVSKNKQLWARILTSKYGGLIDLQNGRDKGWHSQWWKDLRKLYHQPEFQIIHQNMTWKVGCGDKVRFWQDSWLGQGGSLQQKYNQLFVISRQQNLPISKMGKFYQNTWNWDFKWRRNLFDHKNEQAIAFIDDISAISIHQQLQDSMMWKAGPTGIYSTKSAYRLLLPTNRPGHHSRNFKILWKLKIPPRAELFSWRLFRDRLPTRANLLRRHVALQDTMCSLCGNHQEEAGHLFFHCRMTVGLWWESMNWTRTLGAFSDDPAAHFIQFSDGFGAQRNHNRRCIWWIALTSTIWQHRNSLLFKGTPFQPPKVMDDALFHAWTWLKATEKGFNIPFNQWSTNLLESFCCNLSLIVGLFVGLF
ncbi:putative ribonuclease H protein [Glycine max]|nr:putative ribonuclease H protein [Glycine max]